MSRVLKRSVVVVAALMALVFAGPAAPSSPPASSADEATAYQLDAAHDGSIADAGLAAPLTQAWSVTLPAAASYPLIADGMVFVTVANKRVYALNQATGSTIWSRPIAGTYPWSGLTYDRGQVFVANSAALVTAFDAATGSVLWSRQVSNQSSSSSPPTATNGIVYAAGDGSGSTVDAVRESDGHSLWTQSLPSPGGSSPAVTAHGVYLTYDCAYDLDPLQGTVLWQKGSCTGGGGTTPVVAGGHVFERIWGETNSIRSAATGDQQGTFSAGPAPAVANGVAFELSTPYMATATLSAIDGSGLGSTDWTFTGDGGLDTAPIVVGGLVIEGSSGGNLYALDATTGATEWSTNVGSSIPSPSDASVAVPTPGLAAANGTLVVPAGTMLIAYRTAGAITSVPSNQSQPTIEGSPDLNENDAADVGVWSGLPGSYAYQWEQCDASGANCADITGATGPSYVPGAEAYGATLRVRVVATNGVGSSASVESAPSGVLGLATAWPASSAAPVVSGTPTVGQPLSTTNGTWTNSATSYAYQWQRCDDTGANCVDIPGATSSQYTLVEDDDGYEIRSEVLASNAVGPATNGYAASTPTELVVEIGTPAIATAPSDQATAYQLDPSHDGYMADAGLAPPLAQAWSVTLPGQFATLSHPLIVNGTVFVTATSELNNSYTATVYALDQATGSTIWSYSLGSSSGGLAYDRGQILVVGGSGVITALDAASGAVNWSVQLTGQTAYAAPVARNGIVYVDGAGWGGTVYALQESDGQMLWSQFVNASLSGSPAVDAHGVYLSSGCQEEYDFEPLHGGVQWHHLGPCYGGGGDTPVVSNGHVYLLDTLLGNASLSESTGNVEWPFDAYVSPAVANGVAFMLSKDSTLSAIAGGGLGNPSWTFSGDGHLDTAPIVVGGLVFVGSSAGQVYALDATTGTTSWSTSVGAPIPGNDIQGLAAANGTLVVSAGAELMAYRNAGAITESPSNESSPTVAGAPDLSGIQAADVGIWSGLPSVYGYQWELCDADGANCTDIAGATGASYLPPAEDVGVGATLRVRVVATNAVDSSDPVESAPSATSPLLIGQQQSLRHPGVVSGPTGVGQPIATTDGIWTDDPTSYLYKWQRCDDAGLHCIDIPGATSSQYTVVSADAGHEVRSEVRASNAVGRAASYAPSAPTGPVGGLGKPDLLGPPVVSGRAALGVKLATTAGAWTNGPTGYAYQWQRCDNTGSNCVDIASATGTHYTLVAADVGHEIRSEVLASNAIGPAASGYAPSAPTSVVAAHKPVVITLPKVSGIAKVGDSLAVTTGIWKYSPTSYAYQWLRCSPLGASCKKIAGGSSYRLTAADVGHKLKATVTASNAAGSLTATTSNASAKVTH